MFTLQQVSPSYTTQQLNRYAVSDGHMENSHTTQVRADGGTPHSKVARVIETYDLDGLGYELEQRWLATDNRSMSLRELAAYFNEQVLEAAIEDSDMNLLEADVPTLYDKLNGDNVSSADQTRVERRLDREGVDVGAVTNDFVTHQSMHTYLRGYRNVSQPEISNKERREAVLERVQKLQDRSATVTEDAIESLQRHGVVPDGEVDVLVDVQVIYTESGEQYDVFDLIND